MNDTSSIGFFGDIHVQYDVQPADAATLALADGTPLLSYFAAAVADLTLDSSAVLQVLGSVSLETCGRACLSARPCLAFSVPTSAGLCELYIATQTPENSVSMTGVNYYQKLQDQVSIAEVNYRNAYSVFLVIAGSAILSINSFR